MAKLEVGVDRLEMVDTMGEVLRDIARERQRQDEQWGGARHDDTHNKFDWLAYITCQLGQLVKEPEHGGVYERLIKVGALACAGAECLVRARKRDYLELKSR